MPETRVIADSSFQAISSEQLEVVAEALDSRLCATIPELASFRERFALNGPVLVSLAATRMIFELTGALRDMEPGQRLDHPWGYVVRVDDGFMLAGPRQPKAEGNWRSDNFVSLTAEMFDDHLLLKSVISL